jgi:uncharacterized protein YecE (DUF72 family)
MQMEGGATKPLVNSSAGVVCLEFYVGTSGWFYPWNEKRSLDWYSANSGLNAIELNASFYRFPNAKTVQSWANEKQSLRWSIKANRSITHVSKFGENAFGLWERFRALFKPLEPKVDFFLFQLPPSSTPKLCERIEAFFERAKLHDRFALEPRNKEWFTKDCLDWASGLGLTWVSVDSPDLPREVFCTCGSVYVRMHGRTSWYSYKYSDKELEEVATRIVDAKPKKAYVFFNNDHDMLVNARKMLEILHDITVKER